MLKEWIESYVNYLKVGDFEQMLLLKTVYFPSSFFKYRALCGRNLDAINDNYLWLADVNTFNDPFECSLLLDNDNVLRDMFTSDKFLNTIRSAGFTELEINRIKLSQDPFEIYRSIMEQEGSPYNLSRQQEIERIQTTWLQGTPFWKRNLRVCSFSETNQSLLMWAHYANDYKGICVEYDLVDQDNVRGFVQPVYYSDKRPSVKSFNQMNTHFYVFASICKSRDWEYEKEWRLTFFTESQVQGKNGKQSMPTPNSIYLGPRFEDNPEELKARLRYIAAIKEIRLVPMKIHETEYKVTPLL